MAFTAWSQWQAAKRIYRNINTILDFKYPNSQTTPSTSTITDIELQNDSPIQLQRPPPWTIVHGFYATMGGFVFDTQEIPHDQKFLPGSLDRVTLDSHALYVVAIATPELFPRLRTEEIKDKSKANGLAKTIACLQAIWFTAQCIQRIAQGLSISILELNTLAHAFFTLVAYCLWWSKPSDIDEPTIIRGTHADGLCALLCMHSCRDWHHESPYLVFRKETISVGDTTAEHSG